MDLTSALEEATREIGMDCLKPKQCEAIESFVSGRDLFISLPTGYGKSIIYAILPLVFDKIRGIASYYQIHASFMFCLLLQVSKAQLWCV